MNQPAIETSILEYIEVNGRISKKLFEKVVTPKLNRLEQLESQNKKLSDAWEEAATQNYSDKTTIEDLQKENEELKVFIKDIHQRLRDNESELRILADIEKTLEVLK